MQKTEVVYQPTCLELKIYKTNPGTWKTLLPQEQKKPHWLTVDWNKWIDDDSDSCSDFEEKCNNQFDENVSLY